LMSSDINGIARTQGLAVDAYRPLLKRDQFLCPVHELIEVAAMLPAPLGLVLDALRACANRLLKRLDPQSPEA
ncbi:MAG TPA: hypothetical protein VJM81_00005, partial [Rhizorhapis sp.]|nr:hypothetical protein [Rhizorhapis sp.]